MVVTHEMDSAFRIADRMAMLDCGRVLKIGTLADFLELRDSASPSDEAAALIRQFLRGDPEGPLSQRRLAGGYEEDLLGIVGEGI